MAGRTVSVGGGCSFTASGQSAAFNSPVVGQRIAVKGQTGGAALIATSVDKLTPVPVGTVSVTGLIANFSGTPSAFQFTANGTQIRGDAATMFDAGSQFKQLGNGLSVQVIGAPQSGYVYATRLPDLLPADLAEWNDHGEKRHTTAARADRRRTICSC